MTEQQALLAAIRDNCDDDTPRLVYADWLDEHTTTEADRGRAEFIRLDCELSLLSTEFQAPQFTDHVEHLLNRKAELLDLYHRDWLATFPLVGEFDFGEFLRGFWQTLRVSGAQCLASPRPNWALEPQLELRITGPTDDLRRIIESNWLDGVHNLCLALDVESNSNGDELAESLANASCIPGLRALQFWNPTLTETGVRTLAKSTRFQQLTRLNFGGDFTDEGWAAVVDGPIASDF